MDMLPKQICHRCSYKLEEFHKFYIGCLNTDEKLKSQLSWMKKNTSPEKDKVGVPMVHIQNVQIKSEPLDIDMDDVREPCISPIHPVFLKYTSNTCCHICNHHSTPRRELVVNPIVLSSNDHEIHRNLPSTRNKVHDITNEPEVKHQTKEVRLANTQHLKTDSTKILRSRKILVNPHRLQKKHETTKTALNGPLAFEVPSTCPSRSLRPRKSAENCQDLKRKKAGSKSIAGKRQKAQVPEVVVKEEVKDVEVEQEELRGEQPSAQLVKKRAKREKLPVARESSFNQIHLRSQDIHLRSGKVKAINVPLVW